MFTRRELLLTAGVLPLARPIGVASASEVPHAADGPLVALPDRAAFRPTDITYLDSGSVHPISLGALAAVQTYLARRSLDPAAQGSGVEDEDVLTKFARLVNADRDEVTFVQSTTTSEQMVLHAL